MNKAPDDDRLQRARQARQVISGSDIRPPAPQAYSPSSHVNVTVTPAGMFSLAQRNYLIAVAVLLVLGVVLYLVISFGIASIIFFLLALALLAGWIVFWMSGAIHAAWTDIPAEEVLPGITRQTLHGQNQTLVRYVYAPGSVFPEHSHPQEQITAVLSGRIAFEIAGVRYELGPGEAAVIPPNVPHGAMVIGDETVETLNSLSPRRSAGPSYRADETPSA